jgi:tRNA A-37 threonylcarbamoyl transferase component Bud32
VAVLAPVGMRVFTGVSILTAHAALTALYRFHELGWVHGDARVPNIASADKKMAFMIDLAHSEKRCDPESRQEDFGTFLCSWLKRRIVSEEGWAMALKDKPELVHDVSRIRTDSAENDRAIIAKISNLLEPTV